jgi:hypothetical protein
LVYSINACSHTMGTNFRSDTNPLSDCQFFYIYSQWWEVFSATTYHSLMIFGKQHQHVVPYNGIWFLVCLQPGLFCLWPVFARVAQVQTRVIVWWMYGGGQTRKIFLKQFSQQLLITASWYLAYSFDT